MSETIITPYKDIYQQDVVDLILHIQQNEFNVPVTREDQPDLMNIPDFYQVRNGNFWVAVRDGKVIGTIALIDCGNARGALRKMFVDAQHRGKQSGIGQALLDTLLAWAKERDYQEIILGTHEKLHAAQRFYLKNGFEAVMKEYLPPEFPVMAVDNRFFKLSLA